MAKKPKTKQIEQVVEVWNDDCELPGCEHEGPHRHVVMAEVGAGSSKIVEAGPATAIETEKE